MSDDLQKFKSAYLKMKRDMDRLSHMVKPSYLSIYEQMERSLEPIRRQHLEIVRSLEPTHSRLAEITQANQHLHDLIEQATISNRVIEDLKNTHQSWLKSSKPMYDNIAQLQASAKLSLSNVAFQLTVTERLFAGIDFEALKCSVSLPEPAFLKTEEAIVGLTSAYDYLADSIRSFPALTSLPDYTLPGATRELFTTSYALNEIYVADESERERDASEIQLLEEADQETSISIELLMRVDPALARPYKGAHDALRSNSVDRTRHILSSLRELWNHLLRHIAPDDAVLGWVPTDEEVLLHKGKPTRRARVLYVCRGLNNSPLSDFVDHDTSALVKLLEIFNRVHELESELTDEQLRALMLRTDSWLTYILQIWEETR